MDGLGGISTPKPAWHLLPSPAAGSRSAPCAKGNSVFSDGIYPSPAPMEKPGLVVTVGWQSAEIIPSHLSRKQHRGSTICGEPAMERVMSPEGFGGINLKKTWGKLCCAPSEM